MSYHGITTFIADESRKKLLLPIGNKLHYLDMSHIPDTIGPPVEIGPPPKIAAAAGGGPSATPTGAGLGVEMDPSAEAAQGSKKPPPPPSSSSFDASGHEPPGGDSGVSTSKIDPKWSPSTEYVSYVMNGDLWVTDVAKGLERRLTNFGGVGKEGCSAGVAEFVMQEEFDHYANP